MQKTINSTHSEPRVSGQPVVKEMATIVKWLFYYYCTCICRCFFLYINVFFFVLRIYVPLLNLCYKARLSLGYHLRNVKINLRAGENQLITINLNQI